MPAFPHSESDVIHLLEQQCLLSRTVNKGFNAKQTTQNYINLNLTTTKSNNLWCVQHTKLK
jgi:hypothetical protein